MVLEYLKRQVPSSNQERPKLDGVHFSTLSFEANQELSALFTMEEIELVVKESDGNISPDPDGFNFAFFK